MIFQFAPLLWGPRPESNSSGPDHNRGYLGSDKADLHTNNTCADPEGGQGVRTPLKYHKIFGFLGILVRIPYKITKLPSQHSMLGHHRHASETPLLVVFGSTH